MILRDAFKEDYESLGMSFVTTRLKYGMPSAVDNVDKAVSVRVESTIEDHELESHPLGKLLGFII